MLLAFTFQIDRVQNEPNARRRKPPVAKTAPKRRERKIMNTTTIETDRTRENNSSATTGQNEKPSPNQQDPNWPGTGQNVADTGPSWPNAGQLWPGAGQSRSDTGQTTSDTHKQSTSSESDPEYSADQDIEDEDLDEDELDDLDLEAELDGFENYAEVMEEAAADLQAHLKKRNRFDVLSPEAQAAIIALLDTYESRFVARLLRRPPPRGMNFQISKSGLNDFRRRYEKREAERRTNENAKAAADLLDKSDDPEKAFQQAMGRLLKTRLLTITSEPNAPIDEIGALVTALTKLRKQALAERKQDHAETK